MEPDAFDLPDVRNDISDMTRVRADSKGLVFTQKVAPDVPRKVKMDGGKFHQVLLNLLSNAVKFTDMSKVHMHVSCDSTTEPVRMLVVIKDSGIGINQLHLCEWRDGITTRAINDPVFSEEFVKAAENSSEGIELSRFGRPQPWLLDLSGSYVTTKNDSV